MSDGSALPSATEAVREPLARAIDANEIESLLEGDTTAESVGRELGSRVGRELGSRVGRELGAVVAVDVRERAAPRTILDDVARRLREMLAALVRNADVGSAVSRLVDLSETVAADGAAEAVLETALPGAEASEEATGDEDDDSEADEDDDSGADDDTSVSDLSAEDLQAMKEDTYRELLDVMSYRDLQSVAKEVGVKANLSREEMVDQITEQFSGEDDE